MNNKLCKSEIRAEIADIKELLESVEGKHVTTAFCEILNRRLDYIKLKVEEIKYENE